MRHNYEAHTPTREEYILSALGEGVAAKALGIPFRPTNDEGETSSALRRHPSDKSRVTPTRPTSFRPAL
jgi:hypothetical protein